MGLEDLMNQDTPIEQTAVVNIKTNLPAEIPKKVQFDDFVKVFGNSESERDNSRDKSFGTRPVPSPRAGRIVETDSSIHSAIGHVVNIGRPHRFGTNPKSKKLNLPQPNNSDDYYYDLNDEFAAPSEYFYQRRMSSARQSRKSKRSHQKISKTPRPTKLETRLLERIDELEEKMDFVDSRHPAVKSSNLTLAPAKPLAIGRNVDRLPPRPSVRTSSLRSESETGLTQNFSHIALGKKITKNVFGLS